jgi:hypothetical protein
MRWKVVEPCFLKPDDGAGQRRCEPGDVIKYTGAPNLALAPLDAEARAAKFESIRPDWSRSTTSIAKLGLSLGARHTDTIATRRALIEKFIAENSPQKASA